MLVLEEQRYIHEDLERLEQGIADRIRDEPRHVSISNSLTIRPLTVQIRDRLKDRKSTRLNSSHSVESRMPSSA